MLRPGVVCHYFKHTITLNTTPISLIFAYVEWFSDHPCKYMLGYPIEVWCSSNYEPCGPANFIPFNRIHSQFVGGHLLYNSETVLCVCPTKFYL